MEDVGAASIRYEVPPLSHVVSGHRQLTSGLEDAITLQVQYSRSVLTTGLVVFGVKGGENIEYWMGGRWGDAAEFNTLGDMVMVAITGVKRSEFGVHN